MSTTAPLTRRGFLSGVSAAALLPALSAAQTAPPPGPGFAAACRALSGFDTLPRALVEGAAKALDASAISELTDGSAAEDVQKTLLKALYTGMHSPDGNGPEDSGPARFAYSEALMHAAVEDSLNVPSYCGGLPGYWSEKPAGA